jgi:hypothetical protein
MIALIIGLVVGVILLAVWVAFSIVVLGIMAQIDDQDYFD